MLYALSEFDARAPGVREENASPFWEHVRSCGGTYLNFLVLSACLPRLGQDPRRHTKTPNGGVEAIRSNAWGMSGVRGDASMTSYLGVDMATSSLGAWCLWCPPVLYMLFYLV